VVPESKCRHCEATADDKPLRKCPICFQYFCDEHATVMSGRPFCSPGCANYFFFGDPDD